MTMARILVHLDTRERLEEKITLHRRHFSCRQLLDYEGVPFPYRRCHKVDHLFKDFPLNSSVSTENSKGTKQQTSVEQNKGEPEQGGTPTEAEVDATKKTGNRRKALSSPPRTRSKSAAEATSQPGKEMKLLTSYQRKRCIVL